MHFNTKFFDSRAEETIGSRINHFLHSYRVGLLLNQAGIVKSDRTITYVFLLHRFKILDIHDVTFSFVFPRSPYSHPVPYCFSNQIKIGKIKSS